MNMDDNPPDDALLMLSHAPQIPCPPLPQRSHLNENSTIALAQYVYYFQCQRKNTSLVRALNVAYYNVRT